MGSLRGFFFPVLRGTFCSNLGDFGDRWDFLFLPNLGLLEIFLPNLRFLRIFLPNFEDVLWGFFTRFGIFGDFFAQFGIFEFF